MKNLKSVSNLMLKFKFLLVSISNKWGIKAYPADDAWNKQVPEPARIIQCDSVSDAR